MRAGLIATIAWLGCGTLLQAAPPEQIAFFEQRIRPVLVQRCYACHQGETREGGLALDTRAGLLAGGESGPALIPGKPEKSILIWAIRHENGYEMPAEGKRLSKEQIADFVRWIAAGAADPRNGKAAPAASRPWSETLAQRKQWWSFQPLRKSSPPPSPDPAWNERPLDRFVHAALREQGLSPQPPAKPRTLVRRLHLVLTGLPPKPEVVARFAAEPTDEAYAELVDKLLASPEFGERWARHWMDWYRYAETHGSEGDPPIPYASEYREYLIRALNADVPYDQLLREHLAGDLLPNPRVNSDLGVNESVIGAAQLRMVPHGFGVTDAYGEQITFTDNQIDVVSKAMLGLTVSCARCHDHKFDPISQRDYYRFFGTFASGRPATLLVDSPERQATNQEGIVALQGKLRQRLAEHWLTQVERLPQWLAGHRNSWKDRTDIADPLGAWAVLEQAEDAVIRKRVIQLERQLDERLQKRQRIIAGAEEYIDLTDPTQADAWHVRGNGSSASIRPAGSFALWSGGERVIRGIYSAGLYSHLLSDKHAAVFSSNNLEVVGRGAWARVAGQEAQFRGPVRNYPLIQGLHPATNLKSERLRWQRLPTKWPYWQGEHVHVELATAADRLPRPADQPRSWFGISEIYVGDNPPPAESASLLDLVDPAAIRDRESLLAAYQQAARETVTAWRDGEKLSDAAAEFLHALVEIGFLDNRLADLPPEVRNLANEYRRLDAEIPTPRRAPGLLETGPVEQPLLIRGNPKLESEPVPRGFLEVFGDSVYGRHQPGRLQLAEDIVSERNTLTSRVLVNRLWAYVFGRGLVATTDNFGRLGERPSHPELLDWLAVDFQNQGQSIKKTLRTLVLSRTFRSASQAPAELRERDPNNRWLAYFRPRRLDAEAIHDAIQRMAGRQERAVRLPVIRNRLNPFLQTFNAPTPVTTTSRRTPTDVPSQSLTMLNGDLVRQAAEAWGNRISRDTQAATPAKKITRMYWEAFARAPREDELETLVAFLQVGPEIEEKLTSVSARLEELANAEGQLREQRRRFLEPILARLQADAAEQEVEPVDLKARSVWEFEQDARDSRGDLHGKLVGGAQIKDGALVLNGGCLLTKPLSADLAAKTLEALVQVDGLEQQGGGVMTVQSLSGHQFDSIVYAEAVPRRWLAGSDYFRRTNPLNGPAETETSTPVHLLIAYEADGSIRVYRDGAPYAKVYRKGPLQRYARGQGQIAFGLRHGTQPTSGRMFRGKILAARLYDRALTAEEARTAAKSLRHGLVTSADIAAALSPDQSRKLAQWDAALARLAEESAEARRELEAWQRRRGENPYIRVAHALMNTQEFIYVY